MWKILGAIALVLCSNCSVADRQLYNESNAKPYLIEADLVVMTLKVSGTLASWSYKEILQGTTTLSSAELHERWKKIDWSEENFLVLDVFKGSKDLIGSTIVATELSSSKGGIALLGKDILFLNKKNKEYYYSTCSYFDVRRFPMNVLVSSDANLLVDYIVENKVGECFTEELEPVLYREDTGELVIDK